MIFEIANIADVVAAVAVVVSLVYVGIQVNDSTRAVRFAAANDANVAMRVGTCRSVAIGK